MDFTEGTALEIIERLSTAYGVTTQKALAECLGIPAANVSNWVKRDSVPGSAFVKCALDTGCDLSLLTTGKLANSKFKEGFASARGKELYDNIMSNGGKPVLRRIMDAYGFSLQKQLCDLFDISSGTVSTWVRRGYFPGDVVVACALDTGASLEWLATGQCLSDEIKKSTPSISKVTKKNLLAGKLRDAGYWDVDLNFLSQTIIKPIYIYGSITSWIIDASIIDISNGRWLLAVNGKYDVYDVSLLPGNVIKVSNKNADFSCKDNSITVGGKVMLTLELNV
ncbi:helix-turn-helix domain-containing protein [Erwinia sp.]|uniref:helix-turn-helix domain-containing protein n=1 Tax=Erwinia citreus TaxID=558 RepID=UPI00289BB39A|nr:helix-turn-helix domain-containing protein [Erwinia sp.]